MIVKTRLLGHHDDVDAQLTRTLRDRFGLADFRPGQRDVIRALIAGENVLAVMPTGSGKSLCYQLPAILSDGLTVVVSPLISLMIDQVGSLRARGIDAAAIHSGQNRAERAGVFRDLAAGRLKVLYVSPERFSNGTFLERLGASRVAHFIVDEAHCISQWGHDFRVEYRELRNVIALLGRPPVGAFTATATPEVRRDVEVQLGIEGATFFLTGFDRPNLSLEARSAPSRPAKMKTLLAALAETDGPAIVYCATRKDTETIARELGRGGLRAASYHAGMSDETRSRTQADFLEGTVRILAATSAFGMGIDKPDIRLIAHYSISGSIEEYYQEIGRAGRDGAPARCLLLWSWQDVMIRRHFIGKSVSGAKTEIVRQGEERRLSRIIQYAQTAQCRRGFILDYFAGRHVRYRCGECDNCRARGDRAEMTSSSTMTHLPDLRRGADEALDWTRMALSCVERIRRSGSPRGDASRSGTPRGDDGASPSLRAVAAVLRGQRTPDVVTHGLDRLSTWNLLAGWNRVEMARLFRLMKSMKLVSDVGERLELTELGRNVMRGRARPAIEFERDEAESGMIVERTGAPGSVAAPRPRRVANRCAATRCAAADSRLPSSDKTVAEPAPR